LDRTKHSPNQVEEWDKEVDDEIVDGGLEIYIPAEFLVLDRKYYVNVKVNTAHDSKMYEHQIVLEAKKPPVRFKVDIDPVKIEGLATEVTIKSTRVNEQGGAQHKIDWELLYRTRETIPVTIAAGYMADTIPDQVYKFPVPPGEIEEYIIELSFFNRETNVAYSELRWVNVTKPANFNKELLLNILKGEELKPDATKIAVGYITSAINSIRNQFFRTYGTHIDAMYSETCGDEYCNNHGLCQTVHFTYKKCECKSPGGVELYTGMTCGFESAGKMESFVIDYYSRTLTLLDRIVPSEAALMHVSEIYKSIAMNEHVVSVDLTQSVLLKIAKWVDYMSTIPLRQDSLNDFLHSLS
jgi:hypothetical protein